MNLNVFVRSFLGCITMKVKQLFRIGINYQILLFIHYTQTLGMIMRTDHRAPTRIPNHGPLKALPVPEFPALINFVLLIS